jgi:heterodisulfide reductase subunit C
MVVFIQHALINISICPRSLKPGQLVMAVENVAIHGRLLFCLLLKNVAVLVVDTGHKVQDVEKAAHSQYLQKNTTVLERVILCRQYITCYKDKEMGA